MKIMLQNHTFYPILGGIENYLYYVSKTLMEMGHQPIILCEKHDPKLSEFEIYNGIKIIRHPYYNIPRRMLFMKPKIISEQLAHFILNHVGDVDLIISRYPHYCYATCLLNLDTPIFYIPATLHWRYTKKCFGASAFKLKFFNFVWKPILDHMESKCIIMSNQIVTLSQYISDCLAQYYNIDPKKFIVIPPGVDLDRFRKSNGPMGIRREFNIPRSAIVILYVGRLSIEKNVEELVRKFSKLRKKNVTLLIVGYGPERPRLEQLRYDLNMVDRIIFAGLRRDVERFYAAADIFVLPSRYEAFGQVILEAMAAGLPCIAFERALPEYEVASGEIIENGVTGFSVDPHDEHDFEEKLQYLIDNSQVRKKMGNQGREICKRNFTWDGHVRKLLDLGNKKKSGFN